MNLCKWYDTCPVKYFTEKGMLERFWVENYCMANNTACIRYQMEENFEPHPDNMLPNGGDKGRSQISSLLLLKNLRPAPCSPNTNLC